MYSLIRSHSVAQLADALIPALSASGADPLEAAWTVVAHPEMGQWLARRMAAATGVCANQPFPLAATAIWRLMRACQPEIPQVDPFSRRAMIPRAYAALDAAGDRSDPVLAPLKRYLDQRDETGRMRFARQVAGLMDQYLVYRPQWLLEWEAAAGAEHWQSWLWRHMASGRPWHWARCWRWLTAAPTLVPQAPLPAAVHLFAPPVLSPSYLQCIERLAGIVPLTWYQWLPTSGYLGDLDNPRAADPQPLPPSVNPLVASLAQPLRDLLDLQLDRPLDERHLDDGPLAASLLGTLQRDIADEHFEPAATACDRSLLIRRCATPLREAEACRDDLQRRFDADPDLAPDEVLVICPDLEAYLPAISGAFGPLASASARLPWRLLGVPAGHDLGPPAALLAVLERLRNPPLDRDCLDLLRFPAIRRRFELSAAGESDRLRWMQSGGLFDNDRNDKFSWQRGMDRWVDAVTIGGESGTGPAIAPEEVQGLGRLAHFLDSLDQWSRQRDGLRPLSQWLDWLDRLSQAVLAVDDQQRAQLQVQRQALLGLADAFDATMSFAAFAELAIGLGTGESTGYGRAGAITVATPQAARLLPARVIHVLGLTDGRFPAGEDRTELNLIARGAAERGDRMRRSDDRLQFLEWIMSAQHALVLSGCSIDPRTGDELSLSSVLAELEAVLQARLGASAVTTVPLHAFSRQYGRSEIGYADYLNVPEARPEAAWAGVAIAATPAETLAVHQLAGFWRLPPRWFVEQALGAWLRLPDERLDKVPPVEVDALGRYQHLALLLKDPEAAMGKLQRQVTVPDGPMGLAAMSGVRTRADRLLAACHQLTGGESATELPIDVTVDGTRITGMLDGIYAFGRVQMVAGRPKAKRRVGQWISHLLLNAARGPATSHLLAPDGQALVLRPVSDPLPLLAALVAGYHAGQRRGLPFFPEAALAYCEALGKGRKDPAEAARTSLSGRADQPWNESQDPAVRQIWPDPLDAVGQEFAELATAFWLPVLEHAA